MEPHLSGLTAPYDALVKEERWEDYLSALSRDGLAWLFVLQIPRLISHLLPLFPMSNQIILPSRVQLFMESINPSAKLENIESLYHALVQEGDLEGASAAAGAAVSWIWDRGNDFTCFDVWHERIVQLLENESISPLAGAILFGHKATIEHLGRGDHKEAIESFKSGLALAEKAESVSLKVFFSAGVACVSLDTWDIAQAESALFGAAQLIEHGETSPVSSTLFKIHLGMYYRSRKRFSDSEQLFREIEDEPFFENLPLSAWLFVYVEHLNTALVMGDLEQAEALAGKIQNRAIPEENHLNHGIVHAFMGMASLALGNPYKALLHSREASKRAEFCNCPYSVRFSGLFAGQALSDLNRLDEAKHHFLTWLKTWRSAEHHLMTVSGLFELVNLFLKQGENEQARHYYDQILELYTGGLSPSDCLPFYRPVSFFEKIVQTFSFKPLREGDWASSESAVVRIETFGGLRVYMENRLIPEKMWRGSRTKLLLKAIVVYGGANVPADLIADILWPDAEGDIAAGNLKVALSRLRRIGYGKNDKPPSWIEMKNKRVSLAKHLCSVDSIRFVQMLCDAENNSESTDPLLKALDLYTDDFFVHDINEEWIIGHRLYLRDAYVKGVMTLYDRTANNGRVDMGLPHLQRAIDKDPLNESLYVRLMRAFIEQGFTSDAVLVFNRAKETFQKELGTQPGPGITGLARRIGAIK